MEPESRSLFIKYIIYTLCKPQFMLLPQNLPSCLLIIFSSLVNEEMRKKGEQLGADAQLTKPEIGMLVEAIDNLIDKSVD